MTYPSSRYLYSMGFIFITLLLGISFYLQQHDGINPCALCILQRLTMGCLGVIFFFGAVIPFKKIGSFILSTLSIFISSIGALLAGRQIWLQHFPPPGNVDCGAGLQYMLKVLPLHEVLDKVLAGSAECTAIGWQFLSLSLAEWSLICFCALVVLSLVQLIRSAII